MQQAGFVTDILLLLRGEFITTAGEIYLIRQADNKQHLMLVCLTNHPAIKMLIHRQHPVIGINKPQHRSKRGSCSRHSEVDSTSRDVHSLTPGKSKIVSKRSPTRR
ncbi:hypothetical protein RE93_00200 [Klebsiella pneumoniae]|nr:hypothetical protein LQ47_04920 [Klebsiella pneumoniae]OCR56577.1 hypothetical protein QH74_00195 [Klebsiella pneumoniae]OCR63629.1 hypothetical protein QH75_03940 [Klebsiella pneumoniae]OCR70238.1 hypothetical protein RE93_00200 [Klebsiella pneumoniae]OCR75027.1 hypothetical protein RE94_00200 [Klebsiella pneumoniae]